MTLKLEQAVIRFIDSFREFAVDGALTREEWKKLEDSAASDNLDLKEALHYAGPDIVELIRCGVAIATKDNIMTDHEEKYLDFVIQILAVPDWLIQEVRSTVREHKEGQEAVRGKLPTVQPSLHMWPGETCHLEVPATYINTDTKTYPKRTGKLWATNSRLVFVSLQRNFELDWSRVKTVAREGDILQLEMSIKRGNGLYVVDRPLFVEAVISRLVKFLASQGAARALRKNHQERLEGSHLNLCHLQQKLPTTY